MAWSRKQTSLFQFEGQEPILDDAVKQALLEAFNDSRCFPFFPDNNIITALRAHKPINEYKDRFTTIKNDIFTLVAGDNQTVLNRLTKNARLASRIVFAITLIHQALRDLNHQSLTNRRFVLVKEKPTEPGLYGSGASPVVIAHIGQGPKWQEMPTIYLGLNLLDQLREAFKKQDRQLYPCFKQLLLLEERAIETGFSHVNQITPAIENDLDLLLDRLLSKFRAGAKAEPVDLKAYQSFTPEDRRTILTLLDARKAGDILNFNYETNLQGISYLEQLARLYKKANDPRSLREVVRLLVPASGHDIHEIRNRANLTLERIFAPKPFDAPLATRFINVKTGTRYHFTFDMPHQETPLSLRIYQHNPEKEFTCDGDMAFQDYPLTYDSRAGVYTVDCLFDTLGHYDFAVHKPGGSDIQWAIARGTSGRINVIPDIRGHIILEIFTDIFGHTRAYWKSRDGHTGMVYNENGEIIRLGRFSDITGHLEDLKNNYNISAIYLLGVQKRGTNREDWAPEATSPSPFSPMSLTVIEPALGDAEGLKQLVDRAHSLDIKVIVDVIPHLNRQSMELSDAQAVKCYDPMGNLVFRAATDGRYGDWNDGKLLNYRRFDIWEWITQSILTLIDRFDIDGIRFDSAHAVPVMMKKNNYPFFYGSKRTSEEMLEGGIVLNDREDDHFITTGFYDTACRDLIAVPFHSYLMQAVEKTLRRKGKDFFINIAECFWGREKILARTGIIPYNSALFKICENIIHGKADVREIYHLYNEHYANVLPEGTELLGILGNHDERRALNTFGRLGLKAATGLISFLNNIIMDYEGSPEGEGWKVFMDNIYVNWNQFHYASDQGMGEHYRELYTFHRSHLGRGHLIDTENNMVAAAMKAGKDRLWIGAFNFSDSSQAIQLSFGAPDLPIDDDGFYQVVDPIYSPVTKHYNYYTGRELRVSKVNTMVSYTDRVKYLILKKIDPPGPLYHEFFKDSLHRLCTTADKARIPVNFAFREIAGHVQTLDEFCRFFRDFLAPNFWEDHKDHLLLSLKRAFFYIVKNGKARNSHILDMINRLCDQTEEKLRTLGLYLKKVNKQGPIVFLSAEAEPFSKSGGLANVVYELPRELAAMGEEVYVITPRYHTGERNLVEKMQRNLAQYDIHYTGRNVHFFIQDQAYEAGIHSGMVDGIHYYLLDHHEFFDGLYWGYTGEEKLKRRIGFARAAAELITQLNLQPMFVFSNDAFMGPFNGIVRSDPHYFFNDNFKDATFFHIMHNVGWQYFDSYRRFERDVDHFNLFNLPNWQYPKFADPLYPDNINCMATGVRFADRVITVSPSYARSIEIASDGMEHILHDLIGISNAIGRDYPARVNKRFRRSGFVAQWYPVFMDRMRHDPAMLEKIEARYPELLQGLEALDAPMASERLAMLTRMRNKLLLQTARGFTIDPDIILFTMIHRITEQKGFQLLLEASEGIFKTLNYQGIVGGGVASGDTQAEAIAQGLIQLSHYYPQSISVNVGFQDVAIPYLASDLFLMPSLYEPGGISQLEAFACGCFLVARATGGLRDTVVPIRIKDGVVEGNGILFADFTPHAFYDAMDRFQQFFTQLNATQCQAARTTIANEVNYWDNAAREYLNHAYSFKEIIHPQLRKK